MDMKRILVTGGNKGVGKAICESLLKDYSDTYVLLGSRDITRGEKTVNELKKQIKGCDGRLELVVIDTASDASVTEAAKVVASKIGEHKLYGIVNNAGVLRSPNWEDVVNVNYFGPRRVMNSMGGLLQRPGGRVVNMSSASGPSFVSYCSNRKLQSALTEPWTITGGVRELDVLAKTEGDDGRDDPYGFSKALLSAYTWLLANDEGSDLVANSVTPGWIKTDMTVGQGATNPPSKGAVPPVWLLMSDELSKRPSGLYYGSDCIRSPWHYYRGPGEAPYEGPTGPSQ